MNVKEILFNLITICLIFIIPHAAIIPGFLYSIPILIAVWLVLKYSKEGFSDIGFSFKQFKWNAILIGSLVAISTLAFMQWLFFPVLEQFVSWEYNDAGLNDSIRENIWNYIIFVIMGILIGGVYESIVFHGFMFTRLEKMIPGNYSTLISFVITASIFGLYHYQLGALGLINALLVGTVYLGLFLYFKRNLWYSIVCHGVYNSLVMTLIYMKYI